jgi:peptidoglycan/LPS O-acetylase OafA/YrhL
MFRSIFAVAGGFILWSVLWVSYNLALQKLDALPSDETQRISSVGALLALLIGSFALSLLAGYVAATIKAAATLPIAALGALLLAVGIFFQSQYWHLMPLWYHLAFLASLVPMCFVGARLRAKPA